LVVPVIKKNKKRIKKNFGSVNFYANQLKFENWKEFLIKKYCQSFFLTKLQNDCVRAKRKKTVVADPI
jgi:hypothetical protein